MTTKICSIDECESPISARGLCSMHYQRQKRHGSPHVRLTAATPEDAFRMNVAEDGDCLVWTGVRYAEGYGRIKYKRKPIRANRYAWERVNGPIPDGLVVRHKCDNPPCVNVDHLELGTRRDNVNDMIERGRAFWQKGSVTP